MFSLNVPVPYSNTVYGTFRPLYISSRLFGYSPYSATITRQSSNKFYVTKFDNFLFIIHELVYISCTVFNFSVSIHSNLSSSKLLVNGVKYQLIIGCILCCIVVVAEYVFKSLSWNIIESINEFDLKFKALDRMLNHSEHKKKVIHCILLWPLLYIIFSISSLLLSMGHADLLTMLLFLTSYTLINGSYSVAATLYIFLILSLKVRFKALNNCLRDEGRFLNAVNVVKSNNKRTSHDTIVKIAQLHDNLTDIIGSVNRRFSLQTMVLVAADFVFSVFSLYGLYRVYSTDPFSLVEFEGAIIQVMWALFYDLFVLTIIWSGSSVQSEGAYTGVLIHKIINSGTDKQIVEKLVLFSQQLNHQAPIATCKLFPFDWTLLFTIVGATTTYLTILIQFDSSLNASSGYGKNGTSV